MSDMSMLPLSLVPPAPDGEPPAPPEHAAPFAWPVPSTPGYPAPSAFAAPEACEIEGPGGKVNAGRLIGIDGETREAELQIPPARSTLTLKFTQFRRLTLLRPLQPQACAADGDTAFDVTTPLLPQRLLQTYRLRFKDQRSLSIESLGVVDTPLGLFTFTPLDSAYAVQRNFYPRPLLDGFEPVSNDDTIDFSADEPDTEPMPLEELPGAAAGTAQPAPAPRRRLSDMLAMSQITDTEQLAVAIDQQARMPMVRIGEALVGLGFLTEAKLAEALQLQSLDRSLPLGELLVRRGTVTRADLQTALARKMGYPMVDAGVFPVEPEAALRLPLSTARRLPALPLMMHGGRLVVALEDPSARNVIDEIEFSAQCKVLPVLARAGALGAAIERVYMRLGKDSIEPSADLSLAFNMDGDSADSANRLLASLEQQQPQERVEDEAPIEQSDNSLVRLINTMILEAQQQRVSDIHIECQPGHEKVRVRFRRDGVLRPYLELPHTYRSALVARIKIMCDLDISERRKPQDGKINFGRWVHGHKLELRVATIPTANGLEDVVMRLLASARTLPLEGMGLQPDTLAKLKTVIERPYGMVLCVGPTGSGKTTTLHAALGHINTPERKIWTAEDPVEITQAGLRQVQVNPRIDWTFAKALRAFLRADPDVVMVGEIRDGETAQMAIEASLTGHLVMSTLHTNSAPETVTRLLDMGMDPFSFADSLLAVLAQRLVRRLCKHCVTHRPASVEDVHALVDEYLLAYPSPEQRPGHDALLDEWTTRYGVDGVLLHHHAPGCPQCDHSGFISRVGLHELLVVDRELRRLIQTSARAEELQREAMMQGMRTLRQDGIHKVLAGLTTIEEVRATSNA
jgi:type II secretory ATPase GspE/PulE/Tfp pilus assembly ATPase PilB-like protein